MFARPTRKAPGRQRRGVRTERRNGQSEPQDAQQEQGKVQGERESGHLGSSCEAYSASVHYLSTDGNRGIVGGEGMPGTVGRGWRVRVARIGGGSGGAWRRVADGCGGGSEDR